MTFIQQNATAVYLRQLCTPIDHPPSTLVADSPRNFGDFETIGGL